MYSIIKLKAMGESGIIFPRALHSREIKRAIDHYTSTLLKAALGISCKEDYIFYTSSG